MDSIQHSIPDTLEIVAISFRCFYLKGVQYNVSGSLKLYGFGHFENVVFSSVFSLNIKKNLVVVGFYSIFFFLRDGVVGSAAICWKEL